MNFSLPLAVLSNFPIVVNRSLEFLGYEFCFFPLLVYIIFFLLELTSRVLICVFYFWWYALHTKFFFSFSFTGISRVLCVLPKFITSSFIAQLVRRWARSSKAFNLLSMPSFHSTIRRASQTTRNVSVMLIISRISIDVGEDFLYLFNEHCTFHF